MKRSLFNPVLKWFVKLIRNSKYRWLVILGSLIYLVSPIDISPDVFPIIGWIDDGLLASIVIAELSQLMLEQRRKKAVVSPKAAPHEEVGAAIDVESYPVG